MAPDELANENRRTFALTTGVTRRIYCSFIVNIAGNTPCLPLSCVHTGHSLFTSLLCTHRSLPVYLSLVYTPVTPCLPLLCTHRSLPVYLSLVYTPVTPCLPLSCVHTGHCLFTSLLCTHRSLPVYLSLVYIHK